MFFVSLLKVATPPTILHSKKAIFSLRILRFKIVNGLTTSTSNPVSSLVSRMTPASGDSPLSSPPPGNSQRERSLLSTMRTFCLSGENIRANVD